MTASVYAPEVETAALSPERTCPACGSGDFAPLHRGIFGELARPFAVDTCAGCGLGLTAPHPTDAEIAALYPESYYRAGDQRASGPLVAVGRALVARVLAGRDDLTRHLPPGRLLDVGCGNGAFLARMASRGWACSGTDYSEAAVALARRLGADVRLGSLESAAFPAAAFDAVSLFHVLEHLPDPAATLGEVWRILAPGGRLIIEVPNLRAFGARRFAADWFALDVPRHLSHFTPESLARLVRHRGFAVEKFAGATPLSNLYLLFRSALNATGATGPVLFDEAFERAGLRRQLTTAGRSALRLAGCLPLIGAEWALPRRAEAIRMVCRKVA